MTKEQIDKVNSECPYEQGIFFQPNGVPVGINEPVVYTRYVTGGRKGGNCWGDRAESFTAEPQKDRYKVLDLVLKELRPNITYLQYKEIGELINTNEDEDMEYYGNFSEWKVEYIILSQLERYLESLA